MVLRGLAGNIVTWIARQCCLPGWSCWGRPRWWSARTWTATCRCIGRFVGSYGSTWEPLVFHSWVQLKDKQITSWTLTFQISSSCSAGKSRELRRGRRPHPSWSLDRLRLALCSLQQITVMMMIQFKYWQCKKRIVYYLFLRNNVYAQPKDSSKANLNTRAFMVWLIK